MNRLLEIGFVPSGHWKLEGDELRFDLTKHALQNNILYAFVVDGEVMYVGKTIQPLSARMNGYKRPAPGQSTNVRNNALIRELLGGGSAVEIFALPDTGLMHYGAFHLNLAAGLEDSIIRVLQPPWNGGKTEKVEQPTMEQQLIKALPKTGELDVTDLLQKTVHSFTFTLQSTYRRTGFFNVGVADQEWIGADGEPIELFLGGWSKGPVLGTINRTANKNGTPRIMGGPKTREWFGESTREGAEVRVEVYSPTSIRLTLTPLGEGH